MRTPLAILSIATIGVGVVTSFQLPPSLPSTTTTRTTTTRTPATAHRATQSLHDDNGDIHSEESILLSDECPKSLGSKRTFLGVRRESGIMRRMMMEQQQLMGNSMSSSSSSSSITNSRGQGLATSSSTLSTTALSSSATALMPDGGLSPCVIKVLGVGGGGSNAVRCLLVVVNCQLLCLSFSVGYCFCRGECVAVCLLSLILDSFHRNTFHQYSHPLLTSINCVLFTIKYHLIGGSNARHTHRRRRVLGHQHRRPSPWPIQSQGRVHPQHWFLRYPWSRRWWGSRNGSFGCRGIT